MELGTHIRRHRQTAGLSLRKLAELIGVNPAYLSRVERGIVPPSETLIQTIATALRVAPEEFLLLAGRLPAPWQQAIAASPERVIETFRRALIDCVAEPTTLYSRTVLAFGGTRAIEEASFPFEHLSDIAELESWRKEIYRPVKPKVTRPVAMFEMLLPQAPELGCCLAPRMPVGSAHRARHGVVRDGTPLARE